MHSIKYKRVPLKRSNNQMKSGINYYLLARAGLLSSLIGLAFFNGFLFGRKKRG